MTEKLNEPAGIIDVSSNPQKEPMSWAYVAAYYDSEQDRVDNLISFSHKFFMAKTADEVYEMGHNHMPGPILNDYAFEAGRPK